MGRKRMVRIANSLVAIGMTVFVASGCVLPGSGEGTGSREAPATRLWCICKKRFLSVVRLPGRRWIPVRLEALLTCHFVLT